MEKGDVIWIKKVDGSVFCSEFDHITYSSNASGNTWCSIELVPIIGNCISIYIYSDDLDRDLNENVFGALARFDKGEYRISEYAHITLDIYKLFDEKRRYNLDIVQ